MKSETLKTEIKKINPPTRVVVVLDLYVRLRAAWFAGIPQSVSHSEVFSTKVREYFRLRLMSPETKLA